MTSLNDDSTGGKMELIWHKSYNGSKIEFIDNQNYCYLNGKNIILSGGEKPFVFPGKGISSFAVHKINKHVAIGARGLNPNIHIYTFPAFETFSTLPSCAKLEYCELVFSSGNYLASLSGVPDYQLCIWNYKDCIQLCSMKMPDEIPTSLSFNYGSWRQLGITYSKKIYYCNIIRCHTYHEIHCKISSCPLAYEEQKKKSSTIDSLTVSSAYDSLNLTQAAKAGQIGERTKELTHLLENVPCVTPLSQCWLASGILYIGCKEGHVLKMDTDSDSVMILFHPTNNAEIPDGEEKPESDGNSEQVNSIDFIAIHHIGLFAASKNGIIQQFDVFDEEPKLITQYNVEIPISTFSLTLDYETILIGSPQGVIQLHKATKLDQVEVLHEESSSPFVDVKCVYPGTETAVTIQRDGLVQLWKIKDGQKLTSVHLNKTLCSLSCSPVSYAMAIGSESGHICVIDVGRLPGLRVIYSLQLCNSPITNVHFDYNGDYLFAVSEKKHLFIQDGSVMKRFQIYGYLNLPGIAVKVTTDSLKGIDVYISICYENDKKEAGADRLIIFRLDPKFKENYAEKYLSQECDFDPCKMEMKFFTLLSPIRGLSAFNGEAYAHSEKACKIIKLPINEEMPGQQELTENLSEVLSAHDFYDCHQLPGIDLCCSDDYKWLLSSGRDGILQLCLTNSMNKKVIKFSAHDLYKDCAKTLCLTADCYHALLISEDGTVSCYQMTYTSDDAIGHIKETENELYDKMDMTKSLQILESRAIEKMPTVLPFGDAEEKEVGNIETDENSDSSPDVTSPSLNGSWLELKKATQLHEKNKQFAAAKKHIKDSIKQMRATVQKMLSFNASLPELERLERYEFDLDVEEQTRLQHEAKEAVLRVYERIEHDNLAKLYLKDVIKKQCFDDMNVKGRALKAFLIPLEVTNFPLLERSLAKRNRLEVIKKRRNIEKQVDAINKEIMESLTQPVISSSGSQLSEEFSEESPVINSGEQNGNAEWELEAEESGKESKEDEVLEDDASSTPAFQEEASPAAVMDLPSTDGSLGILYGGSSEYLYNQFDLHSRYQKISQVILLQDNLHRIKETFNKEFDELFQKKEMEISRIKEKNKRISQIIKDLDIDEKVYHPEMSVHEKPEKLLIVEDSEVTVEKYMTPEQRKILEEKLAEEEQRKKMKGDNVRERALVQMMNGVLEIKKEDELKKDVPIPHVGEDEGNWTEEEVKIMKEYERKVKELNEEREKYRKNLETELKKMQGSIVESMSSFDELLNNLFLKHIQVVKAIYQEQLKINRIKLNLMVQNILDCQEQHLLHRKKEKIEAQTTLFNVLAKSEKMISDYRVTYDNLVAEDKVSEKNFKLEFPGSLTDNLLRLFRKRPKAYKYKIPENFTSAETDTTNVFQDRNSITQQKTTAQSTLENALEEMDRIVHMPEGLEPKVWFKFCQIRRAKVAKEQEVKNAALTLAEMNAFYQQKLEGQEKLRIETDEIEAEMKKFKKSRQQFNIDIEIQLLIKQGQVELETETFNHTFHDSVLIHRCIIEELNSKIKELAEQKISSMEESKDFKKGIFQQEWEHRKMMMQMEDLRQKMNDIQYLKVTREVQEYLENEEYDAKKSGETDQLEKSLGGLKEIHNRKSKKISDDIKKLRMQVAQKQKDNESLVKQIEILNVEVNERHHIMDVSSEKREYLQVEKKYHEIKQRKKMVDLAKSQAAELAVLRKEVERLRMKTFPALL